LFIENIKIHLQIICKPPCSLAMDEIRYYKIFEDRTPYVPSRFTWWKDLLFRVVSIVFIFVGLDYLWWRWHHSINWDAVWISIPLYVAEILAFTGSVLTIINYWSHKDIPKSRPVHMLSEIQELEPGQEDRPIGIDLYITTYNEEPEIVEDTVRAATRLRYPYDDVDIKIYMIDDGRRDGRDPEKPDFKKMAEQYGIRYITRENNIGFKAGNMNNAFYQTSGDIIVILDADTRVFPGFLEHTTGYFRDPKMAWVQTPQWFYDIPPGLPMNTYFETKYGKAGKWLGKIIPFSSRYIVGKNVFGTDPRLFYDVILRRRNASNAAFSCGAGSLQRRRALELLARREKDEEIQRRLKKARRQGLDPETERRRLEKEIPLRPFVHHISEDILTSILLHSDKRKWKSYQHPDVECKMLSPQSFEVFIKQFSRYAEGTIDITFSRHNPVFKRGLSLRQRLAYLETIWSYLSPFWLLVFITYPILFFFTLIPPLKAFNFDFFIRIVPFLMLNVLVTNIGNWGVPAKRPEQFYQAGFWYKLQALYKVLIKRKIQFNVTSKKVKYNQSNLKHIWPHWTIVILSLAGIGYNLILVLRGVHPSYSAFFANVFWTVYTFYLITPFIRAAGWNEKLFRRSLEYYTNKKQKTKKRT